MPSPSTRITAVIAREVLDSRGRPTVEAEIRCGSAIGVAIAPSGASTGRYEAHELRDSDSTRYRGLGVRDAVKHVTSMLAPAVVGLDASDQQAVDAALCATDGTPDKSRCGANAILAVSLAAAHAAAAVTAQPLARHMHRLWRTLLHENSVEMSLPLPMVNLISGGKHAGGQLDFQDYLGIPIGATSFSEALEWTVRLYWTLGRTLHNAGYEGTLVGDEGGYGPRLPDNEAALQCLVRAMEAAGFEPGCDFAIALDVAATHFYADGVYRLKSEQGRVLTSGELVHRLADWVARYPIVSIEDGLAEDDWHGWQVLTRALGSRIQLLGDDLFTTNVARIDLGVERQAANSVLIKVNQIGTLWETLEAMRACRAAGYRPVVSARSGETEDSTIADLAVGTGAGQIKIGSVARSERLAKYNRLLRLEEMLGTDAPFAGREIVRPLSRSSQGCRAAPPELA
jgi:enolase